MPVIVIFMSNKTFQSLNSSEQLEKNFARAEIRTRDLSTTKQSLKLIGQINVKLNRKFY